AEDAGDPAAIKNRVQRTARRKWIILAGNRQHYGATIRHDGLGKFEPAHPCRPAKVESSPLAEVRRSTGRDEVEYCLGDVIRPGGAADLISDDPQFELGICKPQYRLDEILAVRGENPARAQDDVGFKSLAHRELSGKLAPTINVEWSRLIVFPRRPTALAV